MKFTEKYKQMKEDTEPNIHVDMSKLVQKMLKEYKDEFKKIGVKNLHGTVYFTYGAMPLEMTFITREK